MTDIGTEVDHVGSHDMPKRPRSHELETESRRAFERRVPSSWVVRPTPDDYGVDAEVEIFEDGKATGYTFKLQLKSTDATQKNQKYSVTVDSEKLEYWKNLDVPVLVVLYAARDDSIYARWAQSYDDYFSRKKGGKGRTVTFSFGVEHLAQPDRFAVDILSETRLFRAMHQRSFSLPIAFNLAVDGSLHGHDPMTVRAHVRRALRQFPDLIRTNQSFSASTPSLSIERKQIRVVAPGNLASSTLHYDDKTYAGAEKLNRLATDSVIAIASFFLRLREVSAAATLISKYAQSPSLQSNQHVLEVFIRTFVEADLLNHAWSLIEPAFKSRNTEVRRLADFWALEVLFHEHARQLPVGTRKRIVIASNDRAIIEIENGHPESAGRILYSAGQVAASYDELKEAVDLFDRAAGLDPGYLNRSYFHCEISEFKYLLGRRSEAIEGYRKAIECGGSPEAYYQLSSALLSAGQYREAADIQIDPDAVPPYHRPVARIQAITAKTAYRFLAIDSQERREFKEKLPESMTTQEVLERLRDWDALDSRLWFSLALSQSDAEDALSCILVACFGWPESAKLWAAALIIAGNDDSVRWLFDDICHAAFRFADEDLLAEFDQLGEHEDEQARVAKELLYKFVESSELPKGQVVRFHFGDDQFNVFDTRNPQHREVLGILRFLASLPDEDRERILAEMESFDHLTVDEARDSGARDEQ